MTIDLFELDGPQELFAEIQLAIGEYYENPTSRLALFLVFALNHLREWIAGSSYRSLNKKIKDSAPLTAEERFFFTIENMEEFKVINSLCNRSKHHLVSNIIKTSVSEGLHCDGFCSDSLDQKYYLIDGVDSRIVFSAVIRKYFEWFQSCG